MRLLADQDVYALTVRLLRDRSHDVMTAEDLHLSQASDTDILYAAMNDRRILLTRDRDFGSLVFVNLMRTGVIYLRMLPMTMRVVHDELLRVLKQYSEEELLSALVVIEPGRHRLRRLAP
jgi:predicted nuclease of predicted toxin-antitoxin system